ncbi:hypothetical protein PVAG01_03847 [Phlyctema vagabunda]|uniref:CFEM domain-containing protein n=1 Tax=Phlyctema vagabunda TaxID=108571 RepID=A0ABR4PMP1_9HELO
MYFSKVTLASVFAAVAYSQTIADQVAQLPSCSLVCLSDAAAASNCAITDYACQCGDAKDAITAAATPCIVGACTDTSDILNVQKVTAEICVLQAAAGPVSSASSAIASVSSAASSIAASGSSAVASITSSVGSAASSATSAAGSVTSSIGSRVSSATSAAGSAASSATSSGAATVSSAAAARFQVAGGMAGAALIAAMAL